LNIELPQSRSLLLGQDVKKKFHHYQMESEVK